MLSLILFFVFPFLWMTKVQPQRLYRELTFVDFSIVMYCLYYFFESNTSWWVFIQDLPCLNEYYWFWMVGILLQLQTTFSPKMVYLIHLDADRLILHPASLFVALRFCSFNTPLSLEVREINGSLFNTKIMIIMHFFFLFFFLTVVLVVIFKVICHFSLVLIVIAFWEHMVWY